MLWSSPSPSPSPPRLTAELLRLLCAEPQVKEQVKLYEGIPVLLSLLHSDHLKLLWSVVWILVQVCEDPETSVEIRIWGGIKQLLHILRGWVRVGPAHIALVTGAGWELCHAMAGWVHAQLALAWLLSFMFCRVIYTCWEHALNTCWGRSPFKLLGKPDVFVFISLASSTVPGMWEAICLQM